MSGNLTFTMIKPNSVLNNDIGAILHRINEDGFVIRAMKMTKLSREHAEKFYEIHKGKPFFEEHIAFMTSGPIVALILEKEDAIASYRKLIGATNPKNAEEGTIRKIFADSFTKNAVHGADSDEHAKVEASFFFSEIETFF